MTRMLKKALEGILTQDESDQLVAAFDQIGRIIIVRIPDSLLPKKKLIGETLLKQVKIARSVFCQSSAVEGDYRTRNLEIIAGTDATTTEYKENGCRFIVDVKKVFFSPRLSSERERITNLIQDGEIITNMFAGVGMFSIMAAKNKKCTVHSIDINPLASKLCEKNIILNKMTGKVISINGDAAEKTKNLPKADRTLMLLPERSDEFLNRAKGATKKGGIIHYYSHIRSEKKSDAPKLSEQHYHGIDKESEIIHSKIVRAIGPRYYQTVLDIKI